mgnify:FL=1
MTSRSEFKAKAAPLKANHRTWTLSLLAGATLLALTAGAMTPSLVSADKAVQPVSGIAPPGAPSSFADLVEQVQDAVVAVSVTGSGMSGKQMSMPRFEFPENAPFGDFFRRHFDNPIPHGEESARKTRAMGSGFIVDPAGYIVTNHHVIENAEEITVLLSDGTRLEATIAGHDERTDLALLKVESDQPLAYVDFGDADGARVGDWVVAVGSPFGLGGSVTAGIISARGRDIQSGAYDDYLQIDAPINRGNSGGPLFDNSGRVIGVNTAIYSPSGGNVGIGFAIPASLAKPVVHELMANGTVERGWLGVQIQPVTADVAESLGLESEGGALVASVVPDSPAEDAGLRAGDIVLSMDGEALEDPKALSRRVGEASAGTSSTFRVQRAGEVTDLEVKIGRLPGEERLASVDDATQENDTPRLGIQLAQLTDESRQHFGIDAEARGVLVVGVEKNSPAARSGIRPGSLITMVGQAPVMKPGEVVSEVRKAAAEERPSVLLLVEHDGQRHFVAVKFATA